MKEKRNTSIKYLIFLCVFILISMTGVSDTCFMNTVVQAQTKDTKTEEKKERFVMDSKARIGNYVRYNENMELVTTVTNNEKDFTGYLQVIMSNGEYGKNIMYQTDLVLAAGETKTVSQELRWINSGNRAMVRITDKKENVLAKKRVKTSVLTMDECLIGFLSDEKQQLGYWDNDNVAYLSKEDISASGMNVMDVLIINDFNTGDLEKEQYEAIKTWVERGGTLIIGTGEQVNRTLAMFQDDYLTGRIRDAKNGIADISFQGEKLTEGAGDGMVLHKVEKGLGVISVANRDLGIDKSEWRKEYEYVNAIKEQYSAVLQERLEIADDYGHSYFYGFGADSILRGANEIPSIKNFAIVLCIYILLISVGTFLVLKKKDKLEWTWGVVPVIGIIFAGVVIAIGSKTRISGAYMNYTQVMEFQGEGNSKVKNITYMDVASSDNADYEIVVPEKMQVYAKSFYDYPDENSGEYDDYSVGFIAKDNKRTIALKNNQAFETVKLVSENEETLDGNYQSDMNYFNATLSGTFINQTKLTIKNAVLWTEEKLYKLGTIKPGEKVEITDKTPFTHYTYGYGQQKDYYKTIGVDTNSEKWSLEEARYVDALNDILQNYTEYKQQDGFLFGYTDSDENTLKKLWGISSYGISLVEFPIKINYTADNGELYVPDIVTECQNVSGSYYPNDHTTYMEDKDFVMEYTLEKGEKLTGIYFSELLNPSINKDIENYYGAIYEGDIEAYNWKTKKYEVIFKSDQEGQITDVDKYVGNKNNVRIRISVKNHKEEDIYVPVISITKEAKKNG